MAGEIRPQVSHGGDRGILFRWDPGGPARSYLGLETAPFPWNVLENAPVYSLMARAVVSNKVLIVFSWPFVSHHIGKGPLGYKSQGAQPPVVQS